MLLFVGWFIFLLMQQRGVKIGLIIYQANFPLLSSSLTNETKLKTQNLQDHSNKMLRDAGSCDRPGSIKCLR